MPSDEELDDAARSTALRLLVEQYREDLRHIEFRPFTGEKRKQQMRTDLRWKYEKLGKAIRGE